MKVKETEFHIVESFLNNGKDTILNSQFLIKNLFEEQIYDQFTILNFHPDVCLSLNAVSVSL